MNSWYTYIEPVYINQVNIPSLEMNKLPTGR